MLNEPRPDRFDLHFRILGFNVRVTILFWLLSVVLGYGFVESASAAAPMALLMLIWVACVFVSILWHELGHSLTMRYFGIDSQIVLYHFGGLAIPSRWASQRLNHAQEIMISLAGPVAQLLLVLVINLIVMIGGYQPPGTGFGAFDRAMLPDSAALRQISSPLLYVGLRFFCWPSTYWAVLNLLPVYPLDGGQVTRHACFLLGVARPVDTSLMISVVCAGLVAVYGFMQQEPFLGMMFLVFAFDNYRFLSQYRGGF